MAYDRNKLLSQASEARRRQQVTKAIKLYRRVLDAEPGNVEIHRRVAPLLARARRPEAALASFGQAVAGLRKQGFDEKALGVCREAVQYYPRRNDLWEAIASLELARGRASDAVSALRSGRKHCRGRKRRAEAVRLMRRAHEIAPDDVDVALDLARLLSRSSARAEARRLLAALAVRAPRARLRRVLWAQLWIEPTPRRLLAFLVPRLQRSIPSVRAGSRVATRAR